MVGEFGGEGHRGMDANSIEIWKKASRIDLTLRAPRKHYAELARRRVHPVPFSRELLFSSMAAGKPVIFTGVPVQVKGDAELGMRSAILQGIRSGLSRHQPLRVRTGYDGERIESLSVNQLLRRWSDDFSRVNITDLHIRGSKLLDYIDVSAVSDFNLLAGARKPAKLQEMLTMVVSSAGVFTDSHSDTPDGSNHCFVGSKLWLVWDTFEGIAHGLEDGERSGIMGDQATFTIADFLSIPDARWFTIESGQTLFLPGHLTHKVITLEDYIGVGSFYVMLPSYWRTLDRWTKHIPLWALNAPRSQQMVLVDRITRRVVRKVNQLAGTSEREQIRWGLPHLVSALKEWRRRAGPVALSTLRPDSAWLARSVLNIHKPMRLATRAETSSELRLTPAMASPIE
jgi:hypothetical protein